MLEERFASHLRARDTNGNYITSNEKLLNYLQDPGTIPSILVLGEVERRQVENKQRQQMEAQAAGPMPTVKDQALMQQANAQNMMTGGIDNLGAQRPDMTNVPQPTEMAAADRANMPGLPALAKAGGYVSDFKEGGVVGYQLGGNVNPSLISDPNARPYTGGRSRFRRFVDQYFPTQGMQGDKTREERQVELSNYMMELDKEYGDRIVRNPFRNLSEQELLEQDMLRQEKEQRLREKQLELGLAKDEIGKDGGGFDPETQDDSQKTLQQNLPIGETTKSKPKLQEQESLFEGARLDTGKRDTSKFDELMMEDPDVYRARMEREREETLGESPFGKALDTETERAKKAQSRKKDFIVGEFLMNLGNAVGQQIPGKAIDLTKATDRLAQGNQEYLDMIRNDDKYKLELQRLDRADKEATLKFGIDSEERARINNQKVGLESIKTQVEYDKMANELEKSKISATAYGRYLAASLGRDKLGYQVVSDINAEMQKDPRYMPIYQQLMVIDRKKNPTKEDLQERKELETKIEVEKARRFKEYSKFAGLDQDALSQVDKGLIKPPEGFNAVPIN